MGTAIERPSNTEYTQSIAAYWENSPKIIKIILLQFYFKFSDGNFFSPKYDLHNILKIFIDGKNSYRRKRA